MELATDYGPFTCPFCGRACRAGETDEGPVVLHAFPMCAPFVEIESPIDFLKACNEALRRKRD